MNKENLFSISEKKYTIAKSKRTLKEAFANIIDKNEITIIVEKDKIKQEDIIKEEKYFRLITFDMVLPFNMTGFIAPIATALAKEKIPIFVISAFTTDHILVKEEYLDKTIKVLISIGFKETQ